MDLEATLKKGPLLIGLLKKLNDILADENSSPIWKCYQVGTWVSWLGKHSNKVFLPGPVVKNQYQNVLNLETDLWLA